jgi:uncharacterized membrane protein
MVVSPGLNETGGCASGCTDVSCTILGVIIHIVGSIGINIGQNLQALALANGVTNKCQSKMWMIGFVVFVVASIVTFSALALASASILVPLEAIQFVVNIAFGRIVRKRTITPKMYAGTVLTIGGIAVIVTFGSDEAALEAACFTEEIIKGYWTEPAWVVYMITSFAVAAVLFIVWKMYVRAKKARRKLPYAHVVEPVAYTLSAALFGGGQMIVHTKAIAELFEIGGSSGTFAATSWFFWVELGCVALFGIYWLFRLTECLGMYDALFIIPLMQTSFILMGVIAGGIFWQEFQHLSTHWAAPAAWPLYILGMFMSIGGLVLLAPVEEEGQKADKDPYSGQSTPPEMAPVARPKSGTVSPSSLTGTICPSSLTGAISSTTSGTEMGEAAFAPASADKSQLQQQA